MGLTRLYAMSSPQALQSRRRLDSRFACKGLCLPIKSVLICNRAIQLVQHALLAGFTTGGVRPECKGLRLQAPAHDSLVAMGCLAWLGDGGASHSQLRTCSKFGLRSTCGPEHLPNSSKPHLMALQAKHASRSHAPGHHSLSAQQGLATDDMEPTLLSCPYLRCSPSVPHCSVCGAWPGHQ